MFEKVRKPSKAKGMLAYFIFGAIILVFIGFGATPDRMGNDATGVAAIVNRSQISLADFRDRVQAMEQQYKQRLDQVPPAQRQDMNRALRQRALEDLIQFEAMVQAAAEKGVTVADDEIRDYILEIPAFQEEGRFKRDYYNRFLENRRWTSGQFEDRVRKDLIMRKAQGLFASALKTTSLEEEKDRQAQSTKLDFEVLTINEDVLKAKLPVAPADIKAYLANKENLDKLRKSYDENVGQYAEPEQVRARHILIKVDPSQPGSDAEAKKKIEEIAKEAATGDFGKLAQKYSDDTASKPQGGDLGFFSRERMVPEFATAAFALQPGKVSEPVKTDFGYHLIKVEERKAAHTKTFEEVQNELARMDLAKSRLAGAMKELETLVASGNEAAVRKLAKDWGFVWQNSGPVSLDADQVGQVADSDKLMEAVLKRGGQKGLIPEVVKSKSDSSVVIVKSLSRTEDPKAGMFANYMSSRKFLDAFNGWARGVVGKADVQRNSSILSN